jgi:hypothetical protein
MNKLRTGGRTIEERPNDPCASVCLCGTWSGRVCVWGGGWGRAGRNAGGSLAHSDHGWLGSARISSFEFFHELS